MPWSLSLSVPEVDAGVNAVALAHSRDTIREICMFPMIHARKQGKRATKRCGLIWYKPLSQGMELQVDCRTSLE
jgi:hypothetical protein